MSPAAGAFLPLPRMYQTKPAASGRSGGRSKRRRGEAIDPSRAGRVPANGSTPELGRSTGSAPVVARFSGSRPQRRRCETRRTWPGYVFSMSIAPSSCHFLTVSMFANSRMTTRLGGGLRSIAQSFIVTSGQELASMIGDVFQRGFKKVFFVALLISDRDFRQPRRAAWIGHATLGRPHLRPIGRRPWLWLC